MTEKTKDVFLHLEENDSRLFKTNDDYLLREVAGEYLLIPVGKGSEQLNGMISLNDSFQFLWKQFEAPTTIAEVISRTKEIYEDEDNSITDDVMRFVQESVAYGFIKEEKL